MSKRLLRLPKMLVMGVGIYLISGTVSAQTPFTCTDEVSYRIQGNPSQLNTVNLRTGASTSLLSATTLGNRNLQALGYNSLNNYLYASVSGTNRIVRIGSDGTVTEYTVTGLPAAVYAAGDVGPDGMMYLYVPSSTTIQRINLASGTPVLATAITGIEGTNLPDFSVSPDGTALYGVSAGTGVLVRYSLPTGTRTISDIGITTSVYATYMDSSGDLFVTREADSDVVEIPGPGFPNNRAATVRADLSVAVTNTDGARCANSLATVQTPIGCSPDLGFIVTTSEGYNADAACSVYDGGNSTLITYNLSSGTVVSTSGQLITTTRSTSINNVGFNPTDDYLWGYRLGTNQLARIGQGGTIEYFAINGLSSSCGVTTTPDNIRFNAGDVSSNGILYLLNGIGGDRFIRVDINPASPTYLQKLSDVPLVGLKPSDGSLSQTPDFAFSPIDGLLYGITRNRTLVQINPTTGVVTNLGAVTGIPGSGTTAVPAVFFDADGNLYARPGNSSVLYRLNNIAGGNRTATVFSSSGSTTSGGDGARCPLAPVTSVVISGTVFNDANGLVDNTVNGTAVSTLAGNTLYANLVGSDGTVFDSKPLTNGTYSFTVGANSTYTVVLSNTVGTVGEAPPATTLSNGVLNVGEHIGTNAGNDGNTNGLSDGQITVVVTTTNVTNVNFGIEVRPVVQPNTDASRVNPGGTITSPVSSTMFVGSDAEDNSYANNLTGRTVTLGAATGGSVYYNNVLVSSSTVITNFNPALVTVDPTATGITTVTFPYTVKDNANMESLPRNISVPFTAPLPVSLVSFTAQVQTNRSVVLSWVTAQELNNKGFRIERSKDLISFETVAEVTDVAGTKSTPSHYRLIDMNPYAGTSYYRLTQSDTDGKTEVFKPVSVVINGLYKLYPNPVVNNRITLELDEPVTAQIHLYDVTGKEISASRSLLSTQSVQLQPVVTLPSGVYMVTVQERATTRSYKVIIP